MAPRIVSILDFLVGAVCFTYAAYEAFVAGPSGLLDFRGFVAVIALSTGVVFVGAGIAMRYQLWAAQWALGLGIVLVFAYLSL